MIGMYIDIFIVLTIIVTTFIGYRRGLTGVLYKIIAFILSLIIVSILYKPVANMIIQNTQIDENLAMAIEELIPENILNYENNEKTQIELKDLKEDNLSSKVVDMMKDYAVEAIEKEKDSITGYVSLQLAYVLIRLGTIIILYAFSGSILTVLKFATNIISKLPVIHTIDKIGGLIYGIVKAFIEIYIVFAIIFVISPVINSLGVVDAIESSNIGNAMYNNNVIINFIEK